MTRITPSFVTGLVLFSYIGAYATGHLKDLKSTYREAQSVISQYLEQIDSAGLSLTYKHDDVETALQALPDLIDMSHDFEARQKDICQSVDLFEEQYRTKYEQAQRDFLQVFCHSLDLSDPTLFFVKTEGISKRSSTIDFTKGTWDKTGDSMRFCTSGPDPGRSLIYCIFIPPIGIWDLFITRPLSLVATGVSSIVGILAEPAYGWQKTRHVVGVLGSNLESGQSFDQLQRIAEIDMILPPGEAFEIQNFNFLVMKDAKRLE